MRILKYFWYLFLIITVWFFRTGASLAAEGSCKEQLNKEPRTSFPFITQSYDVGIPFFLVFLFSLLVPCTLLILLTSCATVSDSTPSTPNEGFIKLQDEDLSDLGFSDENKMLKESVVLKYKELKGRLKWRKKIPEKDKETLKNSTVSSAILEKKSDNPYSSYGTLKPLSMDKEPSTKDPTNNKKLLAIYMVGSDLEKKNNLASKDLIELIKGYNDSPNPNTVDIIIAFGGSKKTGWQGVKFVNMEQAKAIFNNEDETNETGNYLYEAKHANMGDKSTLRFFLSYLQKYFLTKSYEQKFLVFWDHGASYQGFGKDQVYNMDGLTLTEIGDAFKEAEIKNQHYYSDEEKYSFDLVGFDACLMGSIEVAQVFEPYAHYFLASEELEPGEGWDWENLISKYAENSDITKTAEFIIKGFVGNSSNRTLSVVDLSKLDKVIEKINGIASAGAISLNTLKEITKLKENKETNKSLEENEKIAKDSRLGKAFLKAAIEARKYGEYRQTGGGIFSEFNDNNPELNKRISIDLKHFAKIAKENADDGAVIEGLVGLSDAIDEYVIDFKPGSSKTHSYGVSFGGFEQSAPTLSGATKDLQEAFLHLKESDTESPTIEKDSEQNSRTSSLFPDLGFQEKIIQEEQEENIRQGNRQSFKVPFVGDRANFIYSDNDNLRTSDTSSPYKIEGIAAKFDDNLYVARVTTLFGKRRIGSNHVDIIGEVEAYPSTLKEGYYFTPRWNRKWYQINYGNKPEDKAVIPLSFQYSSNAGTTSYIADISYIHDNEPPGEEEEETKTTIITKLKEIRRGFSEHQGESEWLMTGNNLSGTGYYIPSYFSDSFQGKIYALEMFESTDEKETYLSYKYSPEENEQYYIQVFFINEDGFLLQQDKKDKNLVMVLQIRGKSWIFFDESGYPAEKPEDFLKKEEWLKEGNGPIEDAIFNITIDDEGNFVDYRIHTYQETFNDENESYVQFDKQNSTIESMDKILFYFPTVNSSKPEEEWLPLPKDMKLIEFTHRIPTANNETTSSDNETANGFSIEDMPEEAGFEYGYLMRAEDINGNSVMTDFYELENFELENFNKLMIEEASDSGTGGNSTPDKTDINCSVNQELPQCQGQI